MTTSSKVDIPRDAYEANSFIKRIGIAQRERARVETEMREALAIVKEAHELQARPHKERIEILTRGLRAWCEANREELTRGGRVKSYKFAAGEISWRTKPPRVVISNAKKVLELMRAVGSRFLRVVESIDRQAMLAAPEEAQAIAGVKIRSAGEDFIVRPFEADLQRPDAEEARP